jgi:hypothetical protein
MRSSVPCRTGESLATQCLSPFADHPCSLSTIIICWIHLDLLERHAHPNGTTHSSPQPVCGFRAAPGRIHDAVMDEFGDQSVTGTLETGISSREEIELQDHHTSSADWNLSEYPWAGRSLGELESIPPVVESQNSGRFPLSDEAGDYIAELILNHMQGLSKESEDASIGALVINRR